ncbi:MAG: cyclase family protein [Alphaproteobacteria bacterium]|nr:cyclase family protein [Alphaproteobacteria bacterium]
MAGPRWTRRPEGSNWGDFGADDQYGRLNLLTPERVRNAAREVRTGLAFCLSLPLDFPGGNVLNPRRHPPRLAPTLLGDDAYINFPMARLDPENTDVVSDDQVLLWCQYSTQWDSLAHVGAWFDADGDGVAEKVYYNGFRAGSDVHGPIDYDGEGSVEEGATGARALAVDRLAVKPVQGRGVLVDLAAHFGRARKLVDLETLEKVMAADGVEIETGDILVLRTGFAEVLLEMNRQPDIAVLNESCAVLDGRDEGLLRWITDRGIAAICADNYAVEAYPARVAKGPRPALPLHHHCLFKLGLPLAELWFLAELAAWLRENGRHSFLLTAPPLRLPGAFGSPVTPVATV